VTSDVRLLVFAGSVTITVLDFRFGYGYLRLQFGNSMFLLMSSCHCFVTVIAAVMLGFFVTTNE